MKMKRWSGSNEISLYKVKRVIYSTNCHNRLFFINLVSSSERFASTSESEGPNNIVMHFIPMKYNYPSSIRISIYTWGDGRVNNATHGWIQGTPHARWKGFEEREMKRMFDY